MGDDVSITGRYWHEPATGAFRGSAALSALLSVPSRIYSRHEFLAFVHPDDRIRVSRMMDEANSATSTYDIRYRIVTRDDHVLSVCEHAKMHRTGPDSEAFLLEALIRIESDGDDEMHSRLPIEKDRLTGLLARHEFFRRFENMIRDHPVDRIVLVNIDLDRFRVLNDSIGHRGADVAVCEIARRLEAGVGRDVLLARSGSDEFLVASVVSRGSNQAGDFVDELAAIFLDPIVIHDIRYSMTASTGVALFPRDGKTSDALMQSSDAALSDAKMCGGGAVCYANAGDRTTRLNAFSIELDMQRAIRESEFVMDYQPMFDFRTRDIIGVEALLRWRHPTRGLLMPSEFIPHAEQNSVLMRELGYWVYDHVFAQVHEWRKAGRRIKAWINTSPSQVHHQHFEADVCSRLLKHDVPPSSIGLELTERTFMGRRSETVQTLQNLKDLGVSIALDDFGVDYSSLAYTHLLPIDTIKIDRAFIREIETDRYEKSIVHAILSIASELGLHVTAEGVEKAGQYRMLSEMGCNSFQGFISARPMSPASFLAFLVSGNGKLAHSSRVEIPQRRVASA